MESRDNRLIKMHKLFSVGVAPSHEHELNEYELK